MSPYDDNWLGGLGTFDDLMAQGDHLGALFQILHEVGATVTLHGRSVTEPELRVAAQRSAADRIVQAAFNEQPSE